MKTLVLLSLALLTANSHACLPFAQDGKSTALISIERAAGHAHGQWCLIATNVTTGAAYWHPRYVACLARVCDPRKALDAIKRVAAASSPSAQLDAELAAATLPPNGAQETYDLALLKFDICTRLYSAPPTGPGVTLPDRAAVCGAAPPSVQWVVGPATRDDNTRPAYSWASGTRSTTSNGRATAGSACNPTVGRVEGAVAYYGVNGRADQVAVCVRAP
jgi:hypothetical protein